MTGSVTNWLKVGFHIGKLGFDMALVLTGLSWRVWRAKGHFKRELLKAGLPEDAAESLARSYHECNKRIFSLVGTGIESFQRGMSHVHQAITTPWGFNSQSE